MKNLRSCLTIIGAGTILFAVVMLVAFVVGYNDPTSIANRLGANLFILAIFVIAFISVGAGLIYVARRLAGRDGS